MDELDDNALDVDLVAIPDTEGEVLAALGGLEDLLWAIAADEDELGQLGSTASEAVKRLSSAVSLAESVPAAQPIAPDGRYELVPLSWATVRQADVAQLGLTAQALGRVWAQRSDDLVVEALDGQGGDSRVAEVARLQGLLALPYDEEVSRLARVLPAGGGRVVLDEETHDAYQRVVNRILGIWHAGDPFGPYLYRGR